MPLASFVKLNAILFARVQKNAKQADTFSPNHITLKPELYESMVRTWNLPLRAIEGSSLVGPLFWCGFDHDEEDKHLREIPPPNAPLGNLVQRMKLTTKLRNHLPQV